VNKHKAYAFHRPSALWIGQIFVDQVFSMSQIMVFCLIVYFTTNLSRSAGAFFIFFLMIWTGNIAMTLLFRIIGCLSYVTFLFVPQTRSSTASVLLYMLM